MSAGRDRLGHHRDQEAPVSSRLEAEPRSQVIVMLPEPAALLADRAPREPPEAAREQPHPDSRRVEVDGRDHTIGPHGHESYRAFLLTSAPASPTLQGPPDQEAEVKTITPAFKQIASGLRFPEGPVAMPDGSVILVEIERRALSRVTPDGKVRVLATLGGGPNGAAMGPRGKIYVTNNGGLKFVERPGKLFPIAQADDYAGGLIQVVEPESGKFETLYDACDGQKLRGPNDLVFDSAGGFWFTDLGKTRERDMDRGAVYYARADGSMIKEAVFPLERPNGIGLSPDERTLYVVETPTARCWAFRLSAPGQIESANGPYRGEKGTVVAGLGGYQMFDSLAVDREGHICVATLITGAVSDIWPDGSRVDQYTLPDLMVTNVCFGGPDLRTAFATLSMGGTLVSFEWPRPGLALNHLNKL
jgi:gluconolactonase